MPRSQVAHVLRLTKQLVGVVSGVAPRLLPVHAHLFQTRHNRLYNEVLQKSGPKFFARFFFNLLSKHFFVRPGFAAMSSQSHSLTTETEPDAEKRAYIVYNLGYIGNLSRPSGKFMMANIGYAGQTN